MRKLFFAIFLPFYLTAVLSSCNNGVPENVKKNTIKIEHSVDSAYANWQPAEGEKIKFRYPPNWILKKKNLEGGTNLFGLIEKTDRDFGDFFELEIYEMRTMNLPFKEFKFGAAHWLSRRFENKCMVRNTEDVKFKGMEARRFEIDIPGNNGYDPSEMYAINGGSRYYLFFISNMKKMNL